MKKRMIAALLLSAVLLVGGSGVWARADTVTVYHTAVNEQMLDLTSDTMPVSVGGAVYVPYTVFDRNVTGVNLGVYYGMDRREGRYTITLYSVNKLLVFDLNRGTCEDGSGEPQSMRAIIRNGRVYVPISRVCQFFGDGLTYTRNETGSGVLIRVCNQAVVLTDSQFIDAASSFMSRRYSDYLRSLNPPTEGTPTPPPVTQPDTTPPPGQTGTHPRVYLAVHSTENGELDRVLDDMDAVHVRALFLFDVDGLEDHAEQIRRIVATGHALGLTTRAADTAAVLEELERGNSLLAHIARTRAHTVWAPNGDAALRAELFQAGWACWQGNVDGTSDRWNGYGYGLYRSVMQSIDAHRTTARVTMEDDATGADALRLLLTGDLRRERYEVRLAVETAL